MLRAQQSRELCAVSRDARANSAGGAGFVRGFRAVRPLQTSGVMLPRRSVSLGSIAWVCALLAGCGVASPSDESAPSQPLGWADEVRLPTTVDLNPDPHVLEVELEARLSDVQIVAGATTQLWTYN